MRLDLYANPDIDTILASIGLKKEQIERFRGAGIQEGEIIIHTRTGGGNREAYPNKILTQNKYYLRDADDDFDSTYADYFFKIPAPKKTKK